MPWKESTIMEQNIEFICEWRTGNYTITELCRNFQISRPTAYKMIARFENEGYEGAIVLDPKCGLYLEDPVCVGDFASLYPSSMLSENLCPSSKVWTKIYNLDGNLISETGEKNEKNEYIYDNFTESLFNLHINFNISLVKRIFNFPDYIMPLPSSW